MFFKHNASEDWKRLAKENPYFGVLSDPRFQGTNLGKDLRNEFFASGREYAGKLIGVLQETFKVVPLGLALDFGCGVGRITQGLAPRFEKVIGLDVAEGMLVEARRNAEAYGIDNVQYHSSLDIDQLPVRSYDLVHSYIVLQHIPVEIGEPIIEKLIESVREGGIGAIHVTVLTSNSWKPAIRNVIKRNRITRILGNIILNRNWNAVTMEMNLYRIENIIKMLSKSGIERFSCIHIDDWGSIGLMFLFQRGKESLSPWTNSVRTESGVDAHRAVSISGTV